MLVQRNLRTPALAITLCLLAMFGSTGCMRRHMVNASVANGTPTELAKTTLPDHVIAPPDVLLIDAATLVPRPPYKIRPLDALFIQVTLFGGKEEERRIGLVPGQPIENTYRVEPDGTVNLGFDYGSVAVVGQDVLAAKKAVKAHLQKRFKADFDVTVTLAESRALQQIRGEHLVRPDGKVTLGTYGSVYVTGMTLETAKAALEQHLAKFLLEPELSLDISGFNSRVYYVVFDLSGAGQQVYRLPSTGNETVMDAIAELKGLPGGTSRKKIWVARPSPADATCNQIMPVDWQAIAAGGSTGTNYQLLPGDRVYVSVDPWIAADSWIAKVTSPFERIFGFALLGNSVVQDLKSGGNQNSSSGSR